MEIAVPIISSDGKIYTNAEIKKPTNKIIANSYSVAQKGNVFSAMLEFVSGCVESYMSIEGDIVEGPSLIRKLTGEMPYVSAEVLSIKIMTLINEDDVIEGVYRCPRCGEKIISGNEYDEDLGIDDRDKISDLGITCMDESDYGNLISVKLNDPVKIKNAKTGEIIETIEEFEVCHPTLSTCIVSFHGSELNDTVKLQMKIYMNSIKTINGEDVDKNRIGTIGKLLFDNMCPKDTEQISSQIEKYGLDKMITKNCPNCGKQWKVLANTSNFFASGLQSA